MLLLFCVHTSAWERQYSKYFPTENYYTHQIPSVSSAKFMLSFIDFALNSKAVPNKCLLLSVITRFLPIKQRI